MKKRKKNLLSNLQIWLHSLSRCAQLYPTLQLQGSYVACQAPLCMKFSRQAYWSGSPFPSPRDLPNPGIKPTSPVLQVDSLPLSHQGSLEYCSVLPCPPPRDLLDPGGKLVSPASAALAAGFFTTEPPGEPKLALQLFNIIYPKF